MPEILVWKWRKNLFVITPNVTSNEGSSCTMAKPILYTSVSGEYRMHTMEPNTHVSFDLKYGSSHLSLFASENPPAVKNYRQQKFPPPVSSYFEAFVTCV